MNQRITNIFQEKQYGKSKRPQNKRKKANPILRKANPIFRLLIFGKKRFHSRFEKSITPTQHIMQESI